jgi:integrase
MRRGEALGLRWRDVDLDAGRLSIVQTVVVNGNEVRFDTPKTDKGRRSISIPSSTLAALRRWSTRQKADRLRWGEDYEDSGLVFTMENGTRLDPRTVSRTFDRLVTAAKVASIRLHDLRHTYATSALASGESVKVVSERLGHASIAITLDVYAHVTPQHDADAAERVERLLVGE